MLEDTFDSYIAQVEGGAKYGADRPCMFKSQHLSIDRLTIAATRVLLQACSARDAAETQESGTACVPKNRTEVEVGFDKSWRFVCSHTSACNSAGFFWRNWFTNEQHMRWETWCAPMRLYGSDAADLR